MNALCLEDWTVIRHDVEGQTRRFSATYDAVPDSCLKCGVVGRLYRHGNKEIEYRDTPAFGKKVVIVADVKRFKCRDCGATFMQPLPDMQSDRQMTRRCAEHLIEQCRERTYAEMSRETGVDESVIRSVCNAEYKTMQAIRHPQAPEVLGIDELTLHKRRRCIFVNLKTAKVMDLLPDMGKAQVVHWISHLKNKERIKVVTMDMWDPYRQAIRGVLPGAKIVADKWHIQKKANDALDKVRARHRRAATRKADQKNPWRIKRILMARPHRLKPRAALILDGILKNYPLIAEAHRAKEEFYEIWDSDTRAEAEQAFATWKEMMPASVAKEFGAVANTVENWREEIFAYFENRYTNARTEAINGLVKIVNRGGRGYSFEHIRAKVLPQIEDAAPIEIAAVAAVEGIGAEGFVCECCGGHFHFPPSIHFPDHIKPLLPLVGRERLRNGIVLCHNCHRRFHTEGRASNHDRSTS